MLPPICRAVLPMAHPQFYANGQYTEAAELAATAAASEPENAVYAAGVAYLQRVMNDGKANVYVSGEGFAAFIRGGGNIGLYQATSAALRSVYNEYNHLSLLDIGVGDGLALLPALTSAVQHLTLVEPSAAMLAKTEAALKEREQGYHSFGATIQSFMTLDHQQPQHWDVAQATYSLHNLPPGERERVLHWLRSVVDRLLIVEFDVPPLFDDPHTKDCVDYVVERYRLGLQEYENNESVIQGFLMPVMFGYFDQGALRSTYEQPVDTWHHNLIEAGFPTVSVQPLFPYWWATAYILDAK
jgi:ubiquinone/menaquinone biosynthesis C-methylase UbiE